MGNSSGSSSPVPYTPIPTGDDHRVRAECSAAFATITATMKSVGDDVREMRNDVSEIGRSQAALEQSARGLWHEIRDELRPGLDALPGMIAKSERTHSKDCPARRKAMRRAESSSDDKLDVRPYRDDVTGSVPLESGGRFIRNSSNGHYEIPRPVLWIGGLIGAAVAASGYVVQLLSSM